MGTPHVWLLSAVLPTLLLAMCIFSNQQVSKKAISSVGHYVIYHIWYYGVNICVVLLVINKRLQRTGHVCAVVRRDERWWDTKCSILNLKSCIGPLSSVCFLIHSRIYEILPQRIQQWQQSPCIAEEHGKKQLERIRREQQNARLRLTDMERRFHELEGIIAKAKQRAVQQDEEVSWQQPAYSFMSYTTAFFIRIPWGSCQSEGQLQNCTLMHSLFEAAGEEHNNTL